ncbi:unnamed protein product [Bemisia tabaci]|uniref:Uncharacterized protein n=1 Tax=Bemisia tabaci TaxID=7038 RepID=A0A9P0C7R4_BEMTA|nr:unnamed protein product [Bemisia tabaci]
MSFYGFFLSAEFTFPRPGEGAGYTRLNEKLEKPKELSGSQRPLLGEETEPPTETTSEMPRRRAGKAPVKEDSPEPITASYEKLEQTKDGTAVCRLGIFYPSTEDGEITEKECEVHCKTHFGKIVSSPEDSIDITEPGIYKFADITLGQICRCTFNYNRLKDYITNRLSEKDFYDFLNLACDDGFCAARVWLKDKKLKVEIEYEMEAKKQNSPVTASTLVTPQMSTTNTPDRSHGSYTMDMCVDSCRTAFGNILSPESAYTMRMPFTKAKLTADGKTCNCVLRSIVPTFCYDKYIRYSVLVKKIKKHFFCAGKVYIESSTRPKTNIEIEYEQAARPPHKKNKDKKPHYVRVSVGLDEQHENQNPGFDGVGEPSIIMRTFDKGVWKKRITHDMCQQKCNEYFGYIYLNDTYKAHFTIGELNIDWSKCKCFVNVEPIKEKIDERLAGRKHKWIEFSEICKTKNGYFAVINFLITHEEYGLKIEPGNALTAEERQRLRQSKRRVDAEQKRALRMAVHRKEKRFFRPVQYKLGECEVYCNTRHGFVFGYPTRVPFTKPELSDDKYNCECWLNVKPLTYFFLVRNVDWDEFFKACEYSYERGVKFLRTGGIGVPPYVQEVREAKFPRIDVVDINGKVKILPGDPHPVGGGPSSSETPVPDVPSNPTVT